MRDVLLAFARVHILRHAADEQIFGTGMMRELARRGYRLGPGTRYPLLHRLHADALLSMASEPIEGKVRKYYRITRQGRNVPGKLRPKPAELAGEVLAEGSGQPPSARRRRRTAAH
jgi:DNA-binding PadR family transcriptional regulator